MVLKTRALSKIYPSGAGCREITLAVGPGEVFGLLGPNGAGKSTFVKLLVGLLSPTSGTAEILGRPLGDRTARRAIGFLPENFRYHEWLTVREMLELHGRLHEIPLRELRRRLPAVLAEVNLRGVENRRVGALSKGMQQRLGLAAALLPNPRLLFLDEPTSALDPLGRREVRETIRRLKEAGTTVFLNSHLLSEVEMVCDRVAVINAGRVAACGQLSQLLADGLEVEMRVTGLDEAGLQHLAALCRALAREGDRLLAVVESEEDIPLLAQAVVAAGGRVYSLLPRRTSLEELFVRLVEEGTAHA